LEETWTGTAWANLHRNVNNFDSRGFVTESVYQDWVSGAWQNKYRNKNLYDTQGNSIGYTYEEWINNAWSVITGSRTTYTYTTAGSVAKETNEIWDPTVGSFIFNNRYSYSYNAAGATTEEIFESWDDVKNSFVPAFRYLYTLTGAQLWSEYVFQEWENGAYENSLHVINPVRNAQGALTKYETQSWSGTAWEDHARTTITYQANGSYQNLTEKLANGNWVNDLRWSTTYNDHDDFEESKDEAWINNAWSITIGSRMLWRYDAAGNVARLVYQQLGLTDKAYVNVNLYTYSNYQTITLANKQATALTTATQLFPNPTAGKATLKLAGLRKEQGTLQAQVLNSVGQVVQQLTLQPQQGVVEQELALENLKAGVYTLRVLTSEGAVVKRIVRQ
jgi:hypothetical protein